MATEIKKLEFKCTTPCNNCPYRKDAPLQHWSEDEFKDLIKNDGDYMGTVYGCHKNNGTVCVGWLINQDERGFPSIALRLKLSKDKVSHAYLNKLH
jgi:hypothetical protein